MNTYFNSPLFQLMLTLTIYWMATLLHKRFKFALFHPGIISIALLILYLKMVGTSFDDYNKNTQIITFWLGPSVVALGLPLYLYIRRLKGNYLRVLSAMICGSLAGIISVVVIAKLLGATDYILLSIASKSITTPIAMEITKSLGGNPAITIVVVFITGFTGALFGWSFLKLLGIKNETAQGIAIGAASHAVGTAEIAKNGAQFGAFGALGLALNGVITAILAPLVVPLLLHLFGT